MLEQWKFFLQGPNSTFLCTYSDRKGIIFIGVLQIFGHFLDESPCTVGGSATLLFDWCKELFHYTHGSPKVLLSTFSFWKIYSGTTIEDDSGLIRWEGLQRKQRQKLVKIYLENVDFFSCPWAICSESILFSHKSHLSFPISKRGSGKEMWRISWVLELLVLYNGNRTDNFLTEEIHVR